MGFFVPGVYILCWILLGSFVFRNIFTGVMGQSVTIYNIQPIYHMML